MTRTAWAAPFTILLAALTCLAGDQEKSRLADALAVQEALKEAIKKAEPSIACILVSRSDNYRQFGDVSYPDNPGKLGIFDRARATRGVRLDDKVRLDLIKKLDLSDPDNVPESFGSGVVIDESGLVLTNRHVVTGATKIYVRL